MNKSNLLKRCCTVLFISLLLPLPNAWAQSLHSSPDGLWSVIDIAPEDFPEGYSPPTDFVALELNEDQLLELLQDAPRETFTTIPTDVVISLPTPDGEFGQAAVAESFLMRSGT